MYKKSVQGWLKHLDFMILDVVCLWISFTLAFNMRHGSLDVLANSLYRDMMWSLALMDIVVIFFFDSLKNVLKRGFYQEFVMTVKQTCLITLCSVFYLFTFKEAENYSRLVLGYTAALYLLISYVLRCLWKNCLRKYFGGAEKRSLLIVTVSDIVDTVIDNIKNKNYGDYFVTGVCILDKKAKGRVIDGVTVVADEDDLVEYVCREWVDEVFINIPESEPYPAELLDKFIEMGVVVHMKLAKSQNLLGKKQFVEHLGTYTVLTTSINSVSRRQIILKRMMDIAGGLAGCIITGILCIFVGPAIYIQSPGPIFFKQTRVGKNGKLFQMYKFRSMYMDAEERKAELMKENRVQDGMMFKLDFDPRIIGSKKLPDGTIKKGVGNFIRDWSLDEFPQFLNVLKGDMSLVGTRPPTVDEWDKYELHHRARLATKPGLTGMWQVSGRSNITDFEEVVKLDKQYISEWTIYYGKSVVEVFAGLEAQKISISSITKKPKVDVINQILGINDYEFIKTTLVIMAAGIKQLAPVGLNIINEIMPALGEGKIVISDRYILSSLILQEMDGVGTEFILNTNSEIIKPDLQLAVIADEKILQERLSERDVLTRFEKENQSKRELDFMEKGVRELRKHNIDIMNIYNNDNLDENVEKVISYIADRWRKV